MKKRKMEEMISELTDHMRWPRTCGHPVGKSYSDTLESLLARGNECMLPLLWLRIDAVAAEAEHVFVS